MNSSHFTSFDITKIHSDDHTQFDFIDTDTKTKSKIVSGMNNVNIFCGENNSGKSRFLRSLCKQWHLGFGWKYSYKDFRPELSTQISGVVQQLNYRGYRTFEEHFMSAMGVSEVFANLEKKIHNKDSISQIQRLINQAIAEARSTNQHAVKTAFERAGGGNTHLIQELGDVTTIADNLESIATQLPFQEIPTSSIYFPTFRSLNNFGTENVRIEQQLKKQFAMDNIFTGLNVQSKLHNYLVNSKHGRISIGEYETYLSTLFFDGNEVFLSPTSDTIKVAIRGMGEREIHSFGDGVSAIIILTFDAFFAQEPTAYFIDEPEIYLHPGLQRRFLDIITGKFEGYSERFTRHQWFMTTHSNHLLDLSLEHNKISIYKFSADHSASGDNKPRIITSAMVTSNYQDRAGLLDALGVSASSVFRIKKIIWVEGPTDILILRTFLRFFQNENDKHYSDLREDIEFSFVMYGGSNLSHFDFSDTDDETTTTKVLSVCDKNLIVGDGDAQNKDRFQEMQKDVGEENVLSFSGKEVENLLSKEMLIYLVEELTKASTKLTAEQKTQIGQAKNNIAESRYSKRKSSVGKYLDGLFDTNYFEVKSTIRSKVKLANLVANKLTIKPYNAEGKIVTEKLIHFISS